MPQQLTKAFMNKTLTSGLHNWIAIHYVLQYPPAFFFPGRRIELLSKSTTRTVAELFFSGLMEAKEVHFPSTGCTNDTSTGVCKQLKISAPDSTNAPKNEPRMPNLALKIRVKDSAEGSFHDPSRSSAAIPQQSGQHVGIRVGEPEDSSADRKRLDTAAERKVRQCTHTESERALIFPFYMLQSTCWIRYEDSCGWLHESED